MSKGDSESETEYLNSHLTPEIKIVVCGCAYLTTHTIMASFSKLLFLLNTADKALFRNSVLTVLGIMATYHGKSMYGSFCISGIKITLC